MGWNGSGSTGKAVEPPKPKKDSGKPKFGKGLLAGLVVVIGAAVAFFVLTSGKEPAAKKPAKTPAVIKEVKPAVTNKAPVVKQEVVEVNTNLPYNGVWRGQKIIKYSVETNGASLFEEVVTADGERHGIIRDAFKPLFEYASDQLIVMALTQKPNEVAPPMPIDNGIEKTFMESLKHPIKIDPSDSDEVKKLKEDVIAARAALKERIEEGMTVRQALEEHFKAANENAELRRTAVKEVRELLNSGDKQGAEAYIEKVNEQLRKMGIMELEMPQPRQIRQREDGVSE